MAIQGRQIEKLVVALDLARFKNSKISPHQGLVGSIKAMDMEEDTIQQRSRDTKNEEAALEFKAQDQLEAHKGQDFHEIIKVLCGI